MSVFNLPRAAFLLLSLSAWGCKGDKGGVDTETIDTDAVDADGDGYDEYSDCDDSDASIHPYADEACNGVDDDCDDVIDDGLDTTPWYYDGDGDGYGDPNETVDACVQPNGYTSTSDDCNDADDRFHPGAEETDCTDPNDYNCDGSTGYANADGDLYPACLECNDADASVYPLAPEYCDGLDNDCDGIIDDNSVDAPTWYIDVDTDGYGSDRYTTSSCDQPAGYVSNSDDCNDLNDDSFPGADELCDGTDTNCDGRVDEDEAVDAPTWYGDSDGDGFGVPDETFVTCYLPSGYAATDDDCDDGDLNVNPDATEICDEVDNNCDGNIDEDDAADATIWYVDADGDGYGLAAYGSPFCGVPEGYSLDYGDCDDGDSEINPDALEYCDKVDNDCDGTTDEADAEDATTWYADLDGDGYGGDTSSKVACDLPAGYGSDNQDCDDRDDEVNPDAQEICNDGIDNNCDGDSYGCLLDLADSDTILYGTAANTSSGSSVATAGDVDADGYGDILVGAQSEDTIGTDAGAAYLINGPVTSGERSLGTADAIFYGEASDYRSGVSVSGADLDADGYADVLIGAHRATDTTKTNQRGIAYLELGPLSGTYNLSSSRDARYLGEAAFDRAGIGVVAGGDFNGDGVLDALVGAYTADISTSETNAGKVYLIEGPLATSATDINLSSSDARIIGDAKDDSIGSVMAIAGDLDGDGFGDFLVGSSGEDTNGPSAGAAYVVSGPVAGSASIGDVAFTLYGESDNDNAGTAVSTAGDTNGDGYTDLLIGAPGDDTASLNSGATYLIYGPVTDTAVIASYAAKFLGESTADELGTSVAGGGDHDGDGTPDFLIGAKGDDYGGSGAGAAFLLYGPVSGDVNVSTADAKMYGSDLDVAAGANVLFGGDLDASGTDDLLITAAGDDRGGVDAGAVFVMLEVGL